jgi:transposase-like protein
MTMTTATLVARAHDVGVDGDPDPSARPRRRSYTAEYKERILAEYEALAAGSCERGALLRREGLYSSHLAEWRKARDAAGRQALTPKTRPRRSAEQVELERLRAKNKALEVELERTKTALEITGKVHALLEQLSESADTDKRSKS